MKHWIILGALALGACSSKEPTDPPGPGAPARVVVTAATTTMVVGATQQLQTLVSDRDGKVVTTALINWTVTPTSVATISSTGVLTAVAPGTAVVTATTPGGISGSISIRVDPDPCQSSISLSAGSVRTFSGGATVSCVGIASTSGTSDYLVIAANTRPVQDDTLSFTLTMTSGGASASIAPLNAESSLDQVDPRRIAERQGAELVDRTHERLRQYERQLLRPILPQVAMRNSTLARQGGTSSVIEAEAMPVGDTVTIRVPNLNAGKDICRDNIPVRGVVRAISTRATILEDVNAPAGGFTSSDFTTIAAEFDNLIYPTDTAWFGRPTDINSDGRITILYTPEVNRLTPASSTGFTAGFFFGSDLLKKTDFPANNECRNQTNEQEIFYLLAPDPTGQFNNVRSTVTVRQGTRGVIAHEFQHMINQGVRQFNPAVQALETFWLNEAMSHMAEEVVGRAIRGFGDFQQLGYSSVNPTPSAANDYNAFFRQNLVRFQRWMQRPDTASPVSVRNRDQLAPRGASWALVRYTADHYANGAARAFFRQLAAGPETDITNLRLRAQNVPFDELITGWLTANFVDGAGFANFATRYTYLSWNIRDVMTQVSNGTFPLQVNTLPGSYNTQALSGSGTYYRLTRAAGAPSVTIRMTASGSTPLTSANATLVIARLN